MNKSRPPLLILLASLAFPLFTLACSGAQPTATPVSSAGWVERTMETTSYRVKVRTGPSVTMEVMQQGAIMTMMDQGQPVNHHIEVHIFDRKSGAEIKTMIPVVGIIQQGAGTSRGLPNVEACLRANHRVTEPHFGDNIYLPDGSYTIDVDVGNETAAFPNMEVMASG